MLKKLTSVAGLAALTAGLSGAYAAPTLTGPVASPSATDRSADSLGLGHIDLNSPRSLPARIEVTGSPSSASASCTVQPGTTLDRWIPQPAGCQRNMILYYGPYTINPGSDLSRPYGEVPLNSGFLTYVRPSLRNIDGVTKPDHGTVHIHHAHWFQVQAQASPENYGTAGGRLNWVFGTGQEETAAGVEDRSAAEPGGPTYGKYLDGTNPQLLIYMIHNETSTAQTVYMTLEVHFTSGDASSIAAAGGPSFHDIAGILIGNTFDIPRNFTNPTSTFVYPHDSTSSARAAENYSASWTSDTDGILIGMGGHLHMGGMRDVLENTGSAAHPCANDGLGFEGGTTLVYSDAIIHDNSDPALSTRAMSLVGTPGTNPRFPSEDFQLGVTAPAWRAPIHKGDVIHVNGIYENGQHGWYYAMNHAGFYIDKSQPTTAPGDCAPHLIGQPTATPAQVLHSVPNRAWDAPQEWCGPGSPFSVNCNAPDSRTPRQEAGNVVHIAAFKYLPGDLSNSGALYSIPTVAAGSSLTFVNDDQGLGSIRHTVTSCPAPCYGPDFANFPLSDGVFDSNTLGSDWIDGGTSNPIWSSPTNLAPGRYTYFCRIHPWMEGAFQVVPRA